MQSEAAFINTPAKLLEWAEQGTVDARYNFIQPRHDLLLSFPPPERLAFARDQVALLRDTCLLAIEKSRSQFVAPDNAIRAVLDAFDALDLRDVEDNEETVDYVIQGIPEGEYVAISHVWGNVRPLRWEQWGRDVLVASEDKLKAIKRLLEKKDRFWMDVLSIRQDDAHDKKMHVEAMDRIYHGAKYVNILLDLEEFLPFYFKYCHMLLEPVIYHSTRVVLNDDAEKCRSLLDFVLWYPFYSWENTTYMQRIWTAQEYTLAADVVLTTFDRTRSYQTKSLKQATDIVKSEYRANFDTSYNGYHLFSHLPGVMMQLPRLDTVSDGAQFHDTLCKMLDIMCGHPRHCSIDLDHIYATCNLLTVHVDVDYQATLAEKAAEFQIRLLERGIPLIANTGHPITSWKLHIREGAELSSLLFERAMIPLQTSMKANVCSDGRSLSLEHDERVGTAFIGCFCCTRHAVLKYVEFLIKNRQSYWAENVSQCGSLLRYVMNIMVDECCKDPLFDVAYENLDQISNHNYKAKMSKILMTIRRCNSKARAGQIAVSHLEEEGCVFHHVLEKLPADNAGERPARRPSLWNFWLNKRKVNPENSKALIKVVEYDRICGLMLRSGDERRLLRVNPLKQVVLGSPDQFNGLTRRKTLVIV